MRLDFPLRDALGIGEESPLDTLLGVVFSSIGTKLIAAISSDEESSKSALFLEGELDGKCFPVERLLFPEADSDGRSSNRVVCLKTADDSEPFLLLLRLKGVI
jgi:hypothetical protein